MVITATNGNASGSSNNTMKERTGRSTLACDPFSVQYTEATLP